MKDTSKRPLFVAALPLASGLDTRYRSADVDLRAYAPGHTAYSFRWKVTRWRSNRVSGYFAALDCVGGDRPAATLTSALTFAGLAAAEALGQNIAKNDIRDLSGNRLLAREVANEET